MESLKIIAELSEYTKNFIEYAENLKKSSLDELNWRQRVDSWSVLECLEHLNLYGDYYLPEIKKSLNNHQTKPLRHFKSGFLGDYFANSMLPKEKLNKMNTFKDKNPIHSALTYSTIDRFLTQQHELLTLLETAKNANLEKIKIAVTLSKFIKIKLGDTFRFVIYHNLRHIEQIKKIRSEMPRQ
jgi:hypothetical protein